MRMHTRTPSFPAGIARLRLPLAFLMVISLALALSSCATLSLQPYNPHERGGIYAQWAPHRGAGEWWYVTGRLGNGTNHLWLYQFTIFHDATLLKQGWLLDVALTNYKTGQHIFEEYSTTNGRKAFGRKGSIVFGKSSITLTRRRVTIRAFTKKVSFDLTLVPQKPPVWEADNGVVGMGHAGKADQRSFYYSFPRMRTRGTISYLDSAGKRRRRRVSGSSWIDRQWGRFSYSGWDWFSIRLTDGKDIMLYAFPKSGFREGTFIGSDGSTRRISGYTYRTTSWQTINGSRYGLSWVIRLRSLGKRYRVVALSPNNFNSNKVLPYWEGLCKVYNRAGKFVGYAVEETTATAHKIAKSGS